jgi:hypothetical protein
MEKIHSRFCDYDDDLTGTGTSYLRRPKMDMLHAIIVGSIGLGQETGLLA